MKRAWRGFMEELGPTTALAIPVILAELGWMAMGVVDTLMVSRIGPEAIGAVGLGNIVYFTVSIFGLGLLLGLDTVVSQAFGAGDLDRCHRALVNGIYLALALVAPLMLVLGAIMPTLGSWGIDPTVLRLTRPYLGTIAWDLAPLLIFTAFRRYLQGTNVVRPIMVVLFVSNIVNWGGNWLLIEGHFGLPALGVVGSAWSTVLSRAFMAAALAGVAIVQIRGSGRRVAWRIDLALVRRLVTLGLPTAIQITLEVGVFAVAAALAGRFGPIALAAHQIVLNLASVTFMVPLGISSAGAVRVGQAIGAGNPAGAARAGWTALLLGEGFMGCAALAFVLVPRLLLGPFTDSQEVLAIGTSLLAVAAVFQLFDGLQIVATGNLRGLGETRAPMFGNTLAHWGLGLPIAYGLGVYAGKGVLGLWIGLSAGLVAAGAILLAVWAYRARGLRHASGIAAGHATPHRPHPEPADALIG